MGPFLVDLISMRALNMENHHSSVTDSSGEGENVASVMMRVKLLFNSQIFMNRNNSCIYILKKNIKGERGSSIFVP